MSKLSLSSFTNLQSGSAITALNNNFAAIILAMENTLSRDGTSPNKMGSNLDMNSYRISNLVAAVSDTEPVRLKEFQDGMDDLETTVQSIASTTQGYLNQVITLYDNIDDIYLAAQNAQAAAEAAAAFAESVSTTPGPKGDKGDQGDIGPAGPVSSLSVGSVTAGAEGTSPVVTITGTAPSQTIDFTIPRGDTGANATDVVGSSALDLPVRSLCTSKALLLDLTASGYASLDENGNAEELGAIANYPSVVLTNATGGSVFSYKRNLETVSPNTLRKNQDYLGSPQGALFEEAHAYLHTRSQPTVAEQTASNVVGAAAPDGWSGTWTGFGDNSVQRYGYLPSQATTTGQDYYGAFLIRMDDGGAPVPSTSTVTGDFSVANAGGPLKPSDGTSGFDIEGPFANSVYRISYYATSTGATIRPPSPIKYVWQSARSFVVGPRSFGPGRYPPSFMAATGTAPSRAADRLSLPVSGFTTDELTVVGEFIAPQPSATTRTIFCLKLGSDKFELNFAASSKAPTIKIVVGGVDQFSGSVGALTPGLKYLFYTTVSRTNKILRWGFSGLAAGSSAALVASPLFFIPDTFDIGNAGGVSQLNSSISSITLIDRALTETEENSLVGAENVASLLSTSDALSSDVQLLVADTFYDGPSVTLTAGTWLLTAHAQYLKTTTTASNVTARLWDGSSEVAAQTKYHASVTNIAVGFGLQRVVVLASTKTIKLQMATTVGIANALMKAQAPNNGTGNNATVISAVRIA